jgi:hypothetical protein
MMKEMAYISEHLSSLRQEIIALRNQNARVAEQNDHSPIDQSAVAERARRLREIKQELSTMLNRPDDATVWWDRMRRPKVSA